jgi:hypothetical protein
MRYVYKKKQKKHLVVFIHRSLLFILIETHTHTHIFFLLFLTSQKSTLQLFPSSSLLTFDTQKSIFFSFFLSSSLSLSFLSRRTCVSYITIIYHIPYTIYISAPLTFTDRKTAISTYFTIGKI